MYYEYLFDRNILNIFHVSYLLLEDAVGLDMNKGEAPEANGLSL